MNSFEQLEQLWREQDRRLERIEHVQRDTIGCLLRRNIASTRRRFLIEATCAAVTCVGVEVYVLSQAGRFLSDGQTVLPYVVFNLAYLLVGSWTAVCLRRLWRHDPATTPAVEMMRFADRMMLTFRRLLVWGIGVLLPIAVASGLPVFARLFGHEFRYSDLQYLAPWRIAAAILVVVAAVAYSFYEMHLVRDLKANLRLYDELLEK